MDIVKENTKAERKQNKKRDDLNRPFFIDLYKIKGITGNDQIPYFVDDNHFVCFQNSQTVFETLWCFKKEDHILIILVTTK